MTLLRKAGRQRNLQSRAEEIVAALRSEFIGAEEKPKRLYRMVEEDVTDLDEILKGRLAALKEERDRAKAALDLIHVAERAPAAIAPDETIATC